MTYIQILDYISKKLTKAFESNIPGGSYDEVHKIGNDHSGMGSRDLPNGDHSSPFPILHAKPNSPYRNGRQSPFSL